MPSTRLLLLTLLGPALLALAPAGAWGQSAIQSPYSSRGLGDLNRYSTSRNFALGDVGLGLVHASAVNRLNPASYSQLQVVAFDIAGYVESRNLVSATQSNQLVSGGLAGMAFQFPFREKPIAVGFGLTPVSSVGYGIRREDSVNFDGQAYTYTQSKSGEGGVNEFYLSASASFLERRLSAGFELGYQFGRLNEVDTSFVNSDYLVFRNEQNISGLNLQLGVQFHDTLRLDTLRGRKLLLRGGATLTLPLTLTNSLTRELLFLDEDFTDNLTGLFTNSQNLGSQNEVDLNTPPGFGLGLGLEGKDNYERMWLAAGLDFHYRDWSQLNTLNQQDSLRSAWSLRGGVELTPEPGAIKSYLKRINYRLGFGFDQTYLNINNQNIQTLRGSVGFGFPVARSFTRLNIGAQFGSRGTTDNGLLQERFYRIVVGISFNEVWFLQRKYQ